MSGRWKRLRIAIFAIYALLMLRLLAFYKFGYYAALARHHGEGPISPRGVPPSGTLNRASDGARGEVPDGPR